MRFLLSLLLCCFCSFAQFQRRTEVESVIASLYRRFSKKDEKIFFFLDFSKSQNAFASKIEEGYLIAVTVGLLHELQTVEEFLAVLAHEFGHISNNHIVVPLKGISAFDYLVLAAAGVLFSSTTGAAGILGSFELLKRAQERTMLSEIRSRENEADAFAIRALQEAGWSLSGMIRVMDRWRSEDCSCPYEFSHPLPKERYRNALQAARFSSTSSAKIPDDLIQIFYHLKKLASIFLNRIPSSFRKWPLYYRILYFSLQNRLQAVIRAYETESDLSAKEFPQTKILYAYSLLLLNQKSLALTVVQSVDPDSSFDLCIKAEVLFQNSLPDEALQLVERAKILDPSDPEPWRIEAKIMDSLNRSDFAWFARANQFFRSGDMDQAKHFATLAKEKCSTNINSNISNINANSANSINKSADKVTEKKILDQRSAIFLASEMLLLRINALYS